MRIGSIEQLNIKQGIDRNFSKTINERPPSKNSDYSYANLSIEARTKPAYQRYLYNATARYTLDRGGCSTFFQPGDQCHEEARWNGRQQ